MQLNSTTDPIREMNDHQRTPPPLPPQLPHLSPLPPLSPLSPSPATVHRYATTTPVPIRHGLNPTPELIRLATPPLPMRLSEARQTNGGSSTPPGLLDGRGRHRTGLRSKQLNHRSNPNEYVDEPVFIHDHRSADGKPVQLPSSSSSSPSSSPSSPALTSESKDKPTTTDDRTASTSVDDQCKESIFCPRCHRCRCVKCQQSRRLPAIHCCGGGGGGGETRGWHCLPEQVVDCCSCLWCARAAYTRCSSHDDFDDDYYEDELEAMAASSVSSSSPSSSSAPSSSSSDALCSCTGRSCCRRWTVLAALTLCLPCLCLYWPMRSLLTACTACYNCRRRGCQCADDDARRALGGHGGGGAHGGHGRGALIIADELLSSNSSSSA